MPEKNPPRKKPLDDSKEPIGPPKSDALQLLQTISDFAEHNGVPVDSVLTGKVVENAFADLKDPRVHQLNLEMHKTDRAKAAEKTTRWIAALALLRSCSFT
jgi:hypothetical protein